MTIRELKPANLMKIPVKIKGQSFLAMIDTGTRNSYIKATLSRILDLNVDKDDRQSIIAFGNNCINTVGSTLLTVNIADMDIDCKMQVLDSPLIKYDVILGTKFLEQQKVIINLKDKIISISNKNSELSTFHVNDLNEVEIIDKRINIYAAKDYIIGNKNEEIVNIVLPKLKEKHEFYFKGIESEAICSVSGILDSNTSEIVLRNSSKKNKKVKEGQFIGTINVLKEQEEEEQLDSKWSLQEIKDKVSLPELNEEDKDKIYHMLLAMGNVMSKNDDDIGEVNIKPHRIELDNYNPIWQKPRAFAKPVEDEIEAQCKELLSNDIIEFSNSNWSAPCVPVRKPDGSLRLCIDYRKLNKVTIPEKYPMPNLNNCLYKANEMKFFTKIDLVRGFYQVKLDEDSKHLTAFSTASNHYHFNRLSFGLKNSAIAFQKMMQQVLAPVSSPNIVIYIDDVLIMSATFEEHLKMVEKVLFTLQKNGVKIKVKKCEFFRKEVTFLGHILTREGVKKSPEYVKKVKEHSKPTTVKELRKFLGLINFQRKFIQNCSILAKPLNELTKRPDRTKIEWTEEREEAFNKLKLEVEKDIILTYPDYESDSSKLELYVDASNTGAGACLMQKQHGEYKVIGYNSMSFSTTQQNYSTTERELTAIRWGCFAFKSFIYGVRFIVFTDHRPLIYMYNMASNSSRVQRTLEELSQYDFEIRYIPGRQNEAADALSRLDDQQHDSVEEVGIPRDYMVINRVEGGGNSMFQSLSIAMKEMNDCNVGENHLEEPMEMRKKVIDELLNNIELYKIPNNKYEKNKLKLMKKNNQLPCAEALLAASRIYEIEIRVFHNIPVPVVYNAEPDKAKITVYLQCIGFCHYNPLFYKKCDKVVVENKYLNTIMIHNNDNIQFDEEFLDVSNLYNDNANENTNICHHNLSDFQVITGYNGQSMCALLDTGSQISIITEDTWERIKQGDETIVKNSSKLISIDGKQHNNLGIVNLNINIGNFNVKAFPFCIVERMDLPSCMLIGLNFLEEFKCIIDFNESCLNIDFKYKTMIMHSFNEISKLNNVEIEESENEVNNIELEYLINNDDLLVLQDSNRVISELKLKILNKIPTKLWKNAALNQFRRYINQYECVNGLLVCKRGDFNATVVTYPFMVEILAKVHEKVAHVGRHKLLDLVQRQFWHPAADTIAREICRACVYCQVYKINVQKVKPPILKIMVSKPFHLMSMDIVQFPKSKRNNVAALVLVDHCSKWMTAIAIKNKTSMTVANILRNNMLQSLLKVPANILTDNGPEFRGENFEAALREYNINHVFSSPYTPQGNGGVERLNRTLINIIKGLVDNVEDWDNVLCKSTVIYNNSYHSQVKCSPADYLMKLSHDPSNQIPVDDETVKYWREGHPSFKSFDIGQKVMKEIEKLGNKSSNKLLPKYDGPYIICKVQSNGSSYEIKKIGTTKIIKCNHKKLRVFNELPESMKKFLPEYNDVTCLEKSDEYDSSDVGVVLPISDSSDFEGFPMPDELSSDESIPVKKKVLVHKKLEEFSTSEYVVTDGFLQSTPRNEVDKQFADYMKLTSTKESLSSLEQTLQAQIDLINMSDDVISNMTTLMSEITNKFNDAITESQFLNESSMNHDSVTDGAAVSVTQSRQFNDFVGFSKEKISEFKDSHEQVKLIFSTCKATMRAGRQRRENLLNDIWEYRKNKSINSTYFKSFQDASSILNEMDDTVEELVPISASTPRRVLRSQGKVPEIPRVQAKTLEYKLKKARLNLN